jgi:tripartite-type tricarboxylate transporter receptor subunit TctC
MNRRLFLAVAAAFVVATPTFGSYPEKPVRLIVPVPPGGASDAAARLIGQALARSMGQPVVVENKPGANGAIAAQAVHAAPPDGYTLLWAQSSMSGLPFLLKAAPFRSLADFTPISIACRLPAALYVHSSVPAASVPQLVAYAKANPDKLNYATGPLSEYMAATQFMKATDTSMVRVPYKGGAPALTDFIEGRTHVYFTPLAQGLPHAKVGKIRMLATMTPARSTEAPDVPTFAEVGLPLAVPNWNAIVAPPGTPAPIVERLSREIAAAVRDPAIRSAFAAQYLVADSSTPADLAAAMAEATELWRRFVAEYSIPAE